MCAMVLLQTVYNAVVRGHRFSQQYLRFVDLERDSGEGLRVFDVDERSRGGILQIDWSDI